ISSSVKPSLTYSCSGSPVRLSNGSTTRSTGSIGTWARRHQTPAIAITARTRAAIRAGLREGRERGGATIGGVDSASVGGRDGATGGTGAAIGGEIGRSGAEGRAVGASLVTCTGATKR